MPFEKQLSEAQTQNQRAQAAAAFAQAAYQNGLIDAGIIEQMVRETSAHADSAEADARAKEIVNDMKTGNFYNNPKYFTEEEIAAGAHDAAGGFMNGLMKLMTGFGHIVQNFIPINFNLSKGQHTSQSTSSNTNYNKSTYSGKVESSSTVVHQGPKYKF